MSTIHDVPEDKRYDCFISFHGSQKLSDLGFKGPGLDGTVRTVAAKVYDRLFRFNRNPSVFYDKEEISGNWKEYLSRAILQLRGGGVALVLLTADYFKSKWCLAELRAFLDLTHLSKVAGSEDQAIDIRVVVLEPDCEAVWKTLEGDRLKKFVGADLKEMQLEKLPPCKRANIDQVVYAICEHVENMWHSNKSICLGATEKDSAKELADSFPNIDCDSIIDTLGLGQEHFPQRFTAPTVRYVFRVALDREKFTKFELDKLYRDTPYVPAKKAIIAFQRKWCSDGWSWSLKVEDNDTSLRLHVSRAESVLEE